MKTINDYPKLAFKNEYSLTKVIIITGILFLIQLVFLIGIGLVINEMFR